MNPIRAFSIEGQWRAHSDPTVTVVRHECSLKVEQLGPGRYRVIDTDHQSGTSQDYIADFQGAKAAIAAFHAFREGWVYHQPRPRFLAERNADAFESRSAA